MSQTPTYPFSFIFLPTRAPTSGSFKNLMNICDFLPIGANTRRSHTETLSVIDSGFYTLP
jgi:hypothetical protein